MATRFYFPANVASPVTPVANGAWGYTSEAGNYKLSPEKLNTALALGTRIGTWTPGQTALDRRYVSEQLMAQEISGTVAMQLMAQEYQNPDNATSRLEIYLVSRDGQTVRGTFLSIGQYGPATEYNNGSPRNKTFADGDAITTLNAQVGDRIVVAVGHSDAAGSSPEASCLFGDPVATADLPVNETQTTQAPGWIEFSANLTFKNPVKDVANVGNDARALGNPQYVEGELRPRRRYY